MLASAAIDVANKAVRSRNPQLSEVVMLNWAFMFLIIAIIAGALGVSGVAGTASYIAWILFVIFLVLFLIGLVTGRRPPVA
jgi:uncharacterized membrane protein YtjA (UPF0391 family)